MGRLFRNIKGAVSVFVTLLMIPAMLISGTAVDMARIHTARSILQDANQLAANAVLTQYDALLHDLYGLFGVMADDPVLAEMVNDYIEISVFGEDWQSRELGTFQLFYGSNLQPAVFSPAPDKDLRNADVLRRQIEEYIKFRGPIVIVKDFFESIENNTLKEDAEIIDDKMAIDSEITVLFDKYRELYEAITPADECVFAVGFKGRFGQVSTSLTAIHQQFQELAECYQNWEHAYYENIRKYTEKYPAVLANIAVLTIGGTRGNNWKYGYYYDPDDSHVWRPGSWISTYSVVGLNTNIIHAKEDAEAFRPKFDPVVPIGQEIDRMQAGLSRKVDELERKLDSGGCNEDLRRALTERGSDGKTFIERYRDILRWEVTPMANTFKENGYNYLDVVLNMLDDVRYRDAGNPPAESLTCAQLAAIASDSRFYLSAPNNRAVYFAGFSDVNYKMPEGFQKFAQCSDNHRRFFEELTEMMKHTNPVVVDLNGNEEAGGDDPGTKQRDIIEDLLKLVEKTYLGLTNDPQGAKHIRDSETKDPERLNIFEIIDLIGESAKSNVTGVIQDPAGSLARAADYLLLLTYDTTMFSNYATSKPDSIGVPAAEINYVKSIAGVPQSPEVNYFYQSEWEYLYNGDKSAGKNLNAVTKLLFMTRLVCNYVTVFKVSEITSIVDSIRVSFSWCPPLGIVLSELARAAFAAAESLVDVAELRSGHKVPLIKNPADGEWICSPSGVMNAINNLSEAGATERDGTERGLTYSNYMIFFFMAKSLLNHNFSDELIMNTAQLIEWNVINFRKNVNANETAMDAAISAPDRFKMEDLKTDFSISTSVELHMIFLSMPFAQIGLDGVIPAKTMPIAVTDSRGY